MNFDVATVKRSILRQEKTLILKECMKSIHSVKSLKPFTGILVKNEVFVVYEILSYLRSTFFKSY